MLAKIAVTANSAAQLVEAEKSISEALKRQLAAAVDESDAIRKSRDAWKDTADQFEIAARTGVKIDERMRDDLSECQQSLSKVKGQRNILGGIAVALMIAGAALGGN